MKPWFIEPLSGKYYGTNVTDGKRVVQVWNGYTGEVSQRELDEGWTEECGFDHVESAQDYKMALAICDVLNKEKL